MSLAAAGAPYGFNYVAADQQSGLFISATIYDITTGTPVFVSKINLVEALQGSYVGVFTPVTAKAYAIITLVYTDVGRTIIDPNRAPGCETVQSVTLSGGSGSGSTVGIKVLKGRIVQPMIVRGRVINPPILRGKVYC